MGLFNRGEGLVPITLNWKDLGLTGPQTVRDLWRQTDVGVFDGSFEGFVARHGVLMLRLVPAQ